MRRDWRAELEQRLGPFPEPTWQWVVDSGHIDELENTPELLEAKVDELRRVRTAWRARPGTVLPARPRPEMTRAEAVSRVYAIDAAKDEAVLAFRKRVLGGRLVLLSQVETWLKARAARERGPDALAEVPVYRRTLVRAGAGRVRFNRPIRGPVRAALRSRFLPYPLRGWTAHVPVRIGGPLDGLLSLAESLSGRYGWQVAQAVVFVLTGVVPLLDGIRGGVDRSWPTGYVRVRLDADPRVPTRELSVAYARVRRKIVGDRHRDLTEKHLRLAVLCAGRDHSQPWRVSMDAWNDQFSARRNWRYARVSNFARDAERALERVLGTDLRS